MSLDELIVFVDAPPHFLPRAVWVLDTLLAQAGRRVAVTSDVRRAGEACLAYATSPVSGVPTLPCSAEAMALFAAGRALPPGSFAVRQRDGERSAPSPSRARTGTPCPSTSWPRRSRYWSAGTSAPTDERDPSGRLPFSASVFAANPALKITEPAVDSYVDLLRSCLRHGSRSSGATLCAQMAGCGRAGGGRAPWRSRVSASLSRSRTTSTTCGAGPLAASPRPATAARRAVLRGDGEALRRELGDSATGSFVTFPSAPIPSGPSRRSSAARMPGGCARPSTSSRATLIPATATSRRRTAGGAGPPWRCCADDRCEVGLHGNDSDRLAPQALAHDRELLERRRR